MHHQTLGRLGIGGMALLGDGYPHHIPEAVTTVLDSVTLLDLAECQQKKEKAGQTTYFV
jgi:hypothetical protein